MAAQVGGFIGGFLNAQRLDDEHKQSEMAFALNALTFKQKIQQMQQEKTDREIYSKFDPSKPNAWEDLSATLIKRGDPKAGFALMKDQATLKMNAAKTLEALAGVGQKEASAAKNTAEAAVKKNELTAQYYNNVTDQASLNAANEQIKAAGGTPAITVFDPNRVKMIRDSAVTAAQKERIQHDRAMEDTAQNRVAVEIARMHQSAAQHAQTIAVQGQRLAISRAELGIKTARLDLDRQKTKEKEVEDQLKREGKTADLNAKLNKLAIPDKGRTDLAKSVAATMPELSGLSDQERDAIGKVAAARAGTKLAANLKRAGKTAADYDPADFEKMIRDELSDIAKNEISKEDTGLSILGLHIGGSKTDIHLGTRNAPPKPAPKKDDGGGSRSVSGKITPAGQPSVDDLVKKYAK